jgi:hypothetical protein
MFSLLFNQLPLHHQLHSSHQASSSFLFFPFNSSASLHPSLTLYFYQTFNMLAPKAFISLLAAASAALALPGSVIQGTGSEHALAARQDAVSPDLLATDQLTRISLTLSQACHCYREQ